MKHLLFIYLRQLLLPVIIYGLEYPLFVIVITLGLNYYLVVWVLRKDDVMQKLPLQCKALGGALGDIDEL